MKPEIVKRVFSPILGKPAWQVKKGHGSFLTFEFGKPSLNVREPKAPYPEMSDRVHELRGRRLVTVRGEWHLWIYCCHWEIRSKDKFLSHNESPDAVIDEAASFLDGQILESVTVLPDASTIFQFDLGGTLKTRPWEEKGDEEVYEQWMLYEPSGMVFEILSDVTYSHFPGNASPDEIDSLPLFP